MIESVITTPLTLTSNSAPVVFQATDVRTRSANCCGWLQHSEGSPLYKVISGGVYDIDFSATISSETTGVVAFGLYQDGVLIGATTSAESITTAGALANISFNKKIRVCCNADTTISIASIPSVIAGVTLTSTDTQVPIITNAIFGIEKIG